MVFSVFDRQKISSNKFSIGYTKTSSLSLLSLLLILNFTKMKNYFMYILLVMVITACTTNENNKTRVGVAKEGNSFVLLEQALEKMKEAPKKFKISSSKSHQLKLPSGSCVHVPANVFVDKNGIPVKGKVDIEWNEYHSVADVISSGITMEYDSLGKNYNLVTGGMFKIRGFQKGEEIFIAKDKEIQVDIASTNQRKGMNFYSFDETTSQWNYETTQSFEPEQKKQTETKQLAKSTCVLDLQVSTKDFPELKDKLLLGWKVIERLDEKTKRSLEKSSVTSKLVKRLTDTTYVISFEISSLIGTTLEIEVQPYTYEEGKASSAANKLKALKDKNELLGYFNDVACGKIIRKYAVRSFGIYNWDYIYRDPDRVPITAKIHLPENIASKPLELYFVCKEDNAVLRINSLNKEIQFNPNKSNYLMAITEQSEIWSCTPRDFQIAKQNLATGSCDFEMKSTGKSIVAHQDFTMAINSVLKN